MLMTLRGIEIEGNVFAFLIQLRAGRGSQALGQGRLALEAMGQLTLGNHLFRVQAGSAAHACIENQPRRSELRSGLICQIQEKLFGLRVVITERYIGCDCRSWFQADDRRKFVGSGVCPERQPGREKMEPARPTQQ